MRKPVPEWIYFGTVLSLPERNEYVPNQNENMILGALEFTSAL